MSSIQEVPPHDQPWNAGAQLPITVTQLGEELPAVIDARGGRVERVKGIGEVLHGRRVRPIDDPDARIDVAHRRTL
jgi:hypothetical protein